VQRRAAAVVGRWGEHLSWHPDPVGETSVKSQRLAAQHSRGVLGRLRRWLGR
jgi:hypothetical protein